MTYPHGKLVKIYIANVINKNFPLSSYRTLENCLFGAVSLIENNDIDKCKYSGYRITFDRKGKFPVGNRFDRNCIIFWSDMSSSVNFDEGLTQELDGAILTAVKMYSINFTENNKKFCFSLNYNE